MAKLSLGLGKNAPKAENAPVETQESLYQKAVKKMEAEPLVLQKTYKKESLELAASMFEQLGDYLDAKERAQICREKAGEAVDEIVEETYEKALRREQMAQTEGEWKNLAVIYGELGSYKEAQAHLQTAQHMVETYARKLKWRRNVLACALVLLLAGVLWGGFSGAFRYLYGRMFMQMQIYGKARETFESLGDYRDSAHLASMSEFLALKEADDTDVVTVGGQRWRILERSGGEALLLHTQPDETDALAGLAYHEAGGEVTWYESTLRAYLNTEYLQALPEELQAYLLPLENAATENTDYDTAYPARGEDLVSILSAEEAESYADVVLSMGTDFWLKTPGSSADQAAFVLGSGEIILHGIPTDSEQMQVLPVIRVDYENAISEG